MAGKVLKSQDYEEIIAQAPTPPNDDPFYEDLKETAAKTIQEAYRQFKQKNMLKPVENISKLKGETEISNNGSNTEKLNNKNDENLTSFEDDESKEKDVKATNSEQEFENTENLTCHDDINNFECKQLEKYINNTTISNLNEDDKNDSNKSTEIDIASATKKSMKGLNGEVFPNNSNTESSKNTKDITTIDLEFDENDKSQKLVKNETSTENLTEVFSNKVATSSRDRPSSNNIGDSNIDKDLAINEYDVNDVNSNNLANQTMKIDPKSPVEVLGYSNIDKDVAINEYDVNDVNSNDLTNQTMKIDLKSPVEEYVKELNSENAISNTNIESSNNIKDTNINVTNRDPTISEDNESQNLGGNESIKNFNVTSTENLKENLYSEVSSADKKNTNNIIDVNKDVSDKDLLNSMTNQPIETNIESLADKHKEEFSTEVAGNFVLKETSNNNIKDTNSNITNTDPTISKYNESQNLGVNESIKNFNVTSTENLKENLYSEVSSADKKSTNNIIDVNNDNLLNAMTNQTIETNKESLADKLKEEFSTDAAGSLVLKESSNNKDANIDITNKDLTFSINDKSDINSNDFINQTKEMDIKSSAEKFKEIATSGSNRESSNNINDTIIDVTTEDLTFKEYDKNDIKLNQSTNQTKQIESSKSENMRADSTNDAKLISHNSENKASEMPNSSNISKDNEITKYSCNNKDGTSFVNNNDLKELLTECDKTVHDDLHSDHIYFEPTAPAEEDIQSVVSIDSLQSNEILQDQAARKIQNAVKNFIERKSKLSSNLGTPKESLKSNWFLGDEPIIANESLPKTTSEISFEETETYVELTTNPPQYLVDSSSNLEAIANNFSRSPTAPVTNRSRNSVDLAYDQSDNVSKDTVSVIGKDAGVIENTNTEHSQVNANNSTYRISSEDKVDEKQAIKCPNLIDQFLNSERHYSEAVNHHNKDTIFASPDITEMTKILSNFTDSQKEQYDSVIPYERLEEPCIKKSARIIGDDVKDAVIIADTAINTDNSSSSDIDDTEDSLSTKTVKLHKPDAAITKMQQRRDSTTKISNLDKPKDYNFDEPSVVPIDNLDTDEEGIVVNKLQREETRESSAQSDFDVIIGGDKDDNFSFLDSINIDETFPSKGSLKRVHTIAGEGDSKSLLKNVTIDESIKYIEPPDYELNSGSLCLDDDTAENIRRKMLAYSFSEADSDCVDKSPNTNDGNNFESKSQKYDDFNVSTALVENIDSSTETESTIVSAVTKIQAGARGYLTRKRLGKASMASDGKSIAHDDINKASFGNAAISESLEYLVQEAAAKRIQKVFRQHYRKKLAEVNQKEDDSFSPEFTTSLESTLAQKRSIMLQRGDALRNDSTPDEGNSSSNGSGSENGKLNAKIDSKSQNKNLFVNDETNNFDKQHLEKNTGGNDTLKATSTAKTAATIRAKKIEENKIRWLAMRQNSMPVQIDSEVLRVIPKYMRKKIKSAEGEKKKDRRQVLMD
ncbi:putative uncharacterized protein DDB_G0282133 [Lucilia sericata]|uniref:putative uncharacterized protein DDB_G0282133 n=1 Tax=Lucilia sericata TaxID=13632 RepID=UPI0018A856A0|nr:putative uncharacterized protein DDB_G0282133 [Lucilia sericata]